MARQRMRVVLSSFKEALVAPTLKQKEAYGRLAHTLCAACCVGAVTVTFGTTFSFGIAMWYFFSLIFWGVVLFFTGAILSKGA